MQAVTEEKCEARTAEPVYGILLSSHTLCIIPFSPIPPCKELNIKSILFSDKVHSALFNPPDDVLPETLPLITSMLNPSLLRLFCKTDDKWCSFDNPYPARKA